MPAHASRTSRSRRTAVALFLLSVAAVWAARATEAKSGEAFRLPWRQAGLTERQAAAHLLDRFAYGARPGDVDRVVETGLEGWFVHQLDGDQPNPQLDEALHRRPTFEMAAVELARQYPPPGRVLRMAVRDGVVEMPTGDGETEPERPDPRRRRTVERWAEEQGFKPQREALADLMIQKLARGRYSENQLHEVLTDFWFNHFNVSLTDNETRIYLWPYERDAIRPHVAGSFRDMLGATARHPAMLLYLDNARSVADEGVTTTLDRWLDEARGGGRRGRRRMGRGSLSEGRRPTGLNENYARELMELHTLGVDGGYTQDDVVEVARAFTGWTVLPPNGVPERLERADRRHRQRAGFVIDGPFLFRADAHDAERKKVLGRKLPAGRGIEDGEQVLDLLATHPSTARHLATKLATRFVSDQPPHPLVDRLAQAYQNTGGNLRALMVTLAESPEFWSEDALRQKIKSPFELTMSALRATGARPLDPRALVDWIGRMGQPLYAYQAPTGYPDRAEAWVNTGALLHRMNFGLQLATGRVAGIQLDLDRFDPADQPGDDATAEELLRLWLARLLPERDPEPTVRRLLAVVNDPELASKVAGAAPAEPSGDNLAAHVVGVILGSPEFQRR